jgi:hypothetical protein
MSAIREWEERCLAGVNDLIRQNYAGRYPGRPAVDRYDMVFDEPARLVGRYPDTVIEMAFTRGGRRRVQRHRLYLEWRPPTEAGPFLDPKEVAREAITVSLHT